MDRLGLNQEGADTVDADKRINIVDLLNNLRLLGSIPRPYGKMSSPYLNMAVAPRISMIQFDPSVMPEEVNINYISMTITWVTDDDNWIKRAVYATSSTLKELMMVREFRLPGEGDEAAYYRSWIN
jgi:hypothetical protein